MFLLIDNVKIENRFVKILKEFHSRQIPLTLLDRNNILSALLDWTRGKIR
jgi:hypothetical protein